jgi:osmotically-inducible protein OsmY
VGDGIAAADDRADANEDRAEAADDRADARADARATSATPGRVAKEGVEKDNTDINERDADERALTPMDQGGSEEDRKITQRIRQAVVADDSLSFTAKNVKIITVDGKVTLRGPVKSEQERSTIGAAAKQVAGARVDNQLEIAK